MNHFLRPVAAVAPCLLALAVARPATARPREDAFAPSSTLATNVAPVPQATRSSASYSLVTETIDLGGGTVLRGGPAYTVSGTALGQPVAAAVQTSTGGLYVDKPSFVGQLYEAVALAVTSPATSVNERASLQLSAAPLLDDATRLAALDPSTLSWTVASGPLASVSSAGLATAGTVYQDTAASVRVSSASRGLSGTGTLTVLNVNTDDYGAYAGDGIDDAWQERYFGDHNPLAGPAVDADGTGQTNLFKYLAGLDPTNPASRFVLTISNVAGQPGQKTLAFSPVYSGRTYTVQYTTSLSAPNWTTLSSVTYPTASVTDPNAGTSLQRFYRVQVSLP